ncbi:ABC transporter permease [Thiohalobacter sp. IOR34]|uniref:ABC transporter permease n=1 Tax=Thiohalobacter sp. IOR34 TaxID=3057176 RepID=UPI0025AF453F|nr:ABC transporter permease [Thiohalobacter sp. IOR34]WJW76343.1 ABC transporter permease [Thiohalobacter sp. IOR34]
MAGWRLWWLRLRVMTAKELLQLARDPVLLIVIAWFFTADVYLAGSGIAMELRQAPLAVIDHDHSAASRELIYRFRPPYFDLRGELLDAREGQRLLDRGEIMLLLEIPEGFQRNLHLGLPSEVQVQIDTSNTVLGTLGSSYAAQIVQGFGYDQAVERLGLDEAALQAVPRIDDRHRVWYNPNQNEVWFMSISELLTVITMLSLMLPAAAAVREKERGTIEQLIVSPLSAFQVLLPKVIAMNLAILAGTAACFALILLPVFQLPIKGSLGLFFLVTALYVFATAGLGLFIATLSRNLAQVTMLVIVVLMPMLLLSGAWTPPEAMPEGLRLAMPLSPLYFYINMGYAILLKGAGASVIWDSLAGLALLGLILFSFGAWRFRRQYG